MNIINKYEEIVTKSLREEEKAIDLLKIAIIANNKGKTIVVEDHIERAIMYLNSSLKKIKER